jgi:hypothetical protein
MFQRMIVGFDGTDTGVGGLLLSMGLAKAFGSQITVVYVYDEELSATSLEAGRELADGVPPPPRARRLRASKPAHTTPWNGWWRGCGVRWRPRSGVVSGRRLRSW